MAFVHLDDGFTTNPKLAGLTSAQAMLYIGGLCYCQRHLTDGRIPKTAVGGLVHTSVVHPKWTLRTATKLVQHGFWDDCGDHYQVHDWFDWNETAEEQKAKISRRKEQQRTWAKKARAAKSDKARRQNVDGRQSVDVDSASTLTTPHPPTHPTGGVGVGAGAPAREGRACPRPEDLPPDPLDRPKLEELAAASTVMATVLKMRPRNGAGPEAA